MLGISVAGDIVSGLELVVNIADESIEPLRRLKHKQRELVIFRLAGPYKKSVICCAISPKVWSLNLLENVDKATVR